MSLALTWASGIVLQIAINQRPDPMLQVASQNGRICGKARDNWIDGNEHME